LATECILLTPHISAQESLEEKAWKLIHAGALLVDVRSPAEYSEGHLPGAVNIPDTQFAERIGKFGQNKNRQIVLYCTTGIRAMVVELKLKGIGYKNVLNAYSYKDMLRAK
jgi:phage shock protein E